MFIRASKKNDLIRKRNEYELKFAARKTLYDSQFGRYREAERIWSNIIKSKLADIFSEEFQSLPHLKIDIALNNHYNRENAIVQNVRIAFIYNEVDNYDSPKWRYDIKLDMDYLTDNVVHLSTPATYWDRINFTNIDNANVLLNSAKLIRKFADFDWQTLVTNIMKDSPKLKHYISIIQPEYDSEYRNPHYDAQILEAQIEEIEGTGMWLKVSNYGDDCYIKILEISDRWIKYCHIKYALLIPRYLQEAINEPDNDTKSDFLEMYQLQEPIELFSEEDLMDIATQLLEAQQ